MKFDVVGNPDVGDLTVTLKDGESILAEAGAMSRMSGNMDMSTRMIGGLMKAMVRKMVGGESLFVGEYTANEDGQFISLAPAAPGTILHRKMNGNETFHLTKGAFLACTPDIKLKTKFGGLKAFFSGEGAFFIEVSGEGDLFYNAYGGVVEKEIDGEYIVDTGHLVAWESTLDYKIGGMGGIKQTLFSGEGLVMRFNGHGRIFMQTRHLNSFASWLAGYCR